MTKEEIIRNLNYTRNKYKDSPVYTFGTDIPAMIDDVLRLIRELDSDAKVGRAVRKAFKHKVTDVNTHNVISLCCPTGESDVTFTNENELLDWAGVYETQ